MDIISLIIFIVIIKKVLGKDKKNNKDKYTKPTNTGEWLQQKISDYVDTTVQQRPNGYGNTATQQRSNGYANTSARQKTNDYLNAVAQQRATKERLEKKYGKVASQTTYQKPAASKSDILGRAKENVKEEAADKFKQQAHADVCVEYRSHAKTSPDLQAHKGHSQECNFEVESDIIKRVNDLIVMGYDGQMDFGRDFIAEGVEMLNSFSL